MPAHESPERSTTRRGTTVERTTAATSSPRRGATLCGRRSRNQSESDGFLRSAARVVELKQPEIHKAKVVNTTTRSQPAEFAWSQTPWGRELDNGSRGLLPFDIRKLLNPYLIFHESRVIDYDEPEFTPTESEPSKELQTLASNTPALDLTSGEWVKSNEVAKLEDKTTGVLKSLRVREDSLRNEETTLGRDPYGRIWRREEAKRGKPTWYYLPSLQSTKRQKKASSES